MFFFSPVFFDVNLGIGFRNGWMSRHPFLPFPLRSLSFRFLYSKCFFYCPKFKCQDHHFIVVGKMLMLSFGNVQALQKSPGFVAGFDAFSYCHALNQEDLCKDFT